MKRANGESRSSRVASHSAVLQFAPGEFFGGTRRSFTAHGIHVTHRLADRPPEAVPTHKHTDAHFVWVTGGDYVSTAEGVTARGLPVLVFNPPGTIHRDHFIGGRGSFFAISLEASKAASAGADCLLPEGPVYLGSLPQIALTQRIASSSACRGDGLVVDALVHELLGTMDRHAEKLGASPPAWLNHAIDLLKDRYRDDLSIADVAAAVDMHPIHLARTFRRHLRCTPGDFARSHRLARATLLLARSQLTLVEVAQDCGYADQSHFSKIFCMSLGVPPGEYRRATAPPRRR